MKFITVSELRLRATQVVKELEKTREEVVVTKNGKPIVLMRYIDDTVFELKKDKSEKYRTRAGRQPVKHQKNPDLPSIR
jgi:PHD/YefM family antitoxin component YafN of YafNO toxin-antitoxin module